jgi:RHS repeat-associated protein
MNLQFTAQCGTAYVYFRGKLVRREAVPQLQNGVWVAQTGTTIGTDRLGSVTYRGYGGAALYYPYGEEETLTANDTQKFATYTRDSATGMDYAQNRYYASQIGRFTTADPYRASAKRRNPQSWNRYAYVQGDPINGNDPSGLDCMIVGADSETIGDMYGCGGGPVSGTDDDDPGASVDSCAQAAFFGVSCGGSGGGNGGSGGGSAACYGNSLFSTIPWCDSSGNPAPLQPTQPPDCPPNIHAFFYDFWSEFVTMAAALNDNINVIITFASFESGWANAYHRANRNLFSEMKPNGKAGQKLIHWDSFTNEMMYAITTLYGAGVTGISDPTTFANMIVDIHWSGDPRATYVAGFDTRYTQVLFWEPICLH